MFSSSTGFFRLKILKFTKNQDGFLLTIQYLSNLEDTSRFLICRRTLSLLSDTSATFPFQNEKQLLLLTWLPYQFFFLYSQQICQVMVVFVIRVYQAA